MSKDEYAYLSRFTSDTAAMFIPHNVARRLLNKGWIEWVPLVGINYAITEAGKLAVARHEHSSK